MINRSSLAILAAAMGGMLKNDIPVSANKRGTKKASNFKKPTKHYAEESKKRRKMAAKSRKINRRK